MKTKHRYLYVYIVIFVLFAGVIKVNAISSGFLVTDISQEEQDLFMSNINISLLTKEPIKRGVKCFAVSHDGKIAVCPNSTYADEVCVYSSDGDFLYGYSFDCSQSYAVEWDKDNINIYFVRSDVIVSLDSEGVVLDIKKVEDTIDNNSHCNNLLYSNRRIVGETTYILKNDIKIFNYVSNSYSQISVIEANGVESIIYDVDSTVLLNIVRVLFIFCFIVLFLITFAIKTKTRVTNQTNQGDQSGDGSMIEL